jgi:hypothetical protein
VPCPGIVEIRGGDQHDVVRVEIAVGDPGRVRFRDRLDDGAQELEGLGACTAGRALPLAPRKIRSKCLAIEPLHHDPRDPRRILLRRRDPDVHDADDRRVAKFGDQPGFREELRDHLLPLGCRRARHRLEHLDRERNPEPEVLPGIHHTEAAFDDTCIDAVLPFEQRPDQAERVVGCLAHGGESVCTNSR